MTTVRVTDAQIAQFLDAEVAEGSGGGTVREYLVALLRAFWAGNASEKYGMTGESDWRYDLYAPMRRLGFIPPWRDGWGIEYPPADDAEPEWNRRMRADAIIDRAIEALL